jgi:hypothetical protein
MKVVCSNLSIVWMDKPHKPIFSAGANSIILCSEYVEDNVKLNSTVITGVGKIYQHGVCLRYNSLIRYDCIDTDKFELTVAIKN